MQPLLEAGVDSLGAVELRNKLEANLATELPATVTFDYPTTSALASFLATRMFPAQPDQAADAPTSAHARSQDSVERDIQEILRAMLGADIQPNQVRLHNQPFKQTCQMGSSCLAQMPALRAKQESLHGRWRVSLASQVYCRQSTLCESYKQSKIPNGRQQ